MKTLKNFEKKAYWLVVVMLIMTLVLSSCNVSAESEGIPMGGGKVAAPAVVEPETATAISEIRSSTQTSEALEELVPTSTATMEPTPTYTSTPTVDPVCEGLTDLGCGFAKISQRSGVALSVLEFSQYSYIQEATGEQRNNLKKSADVEKLLNEYGFIPSMGDVIPFYDLDQTKVVLDIPYEDVAGTSMYLVVVQHYDVARLPDGFPDYANTYGPDPYQPAEAVPNVSFALISLGKEASIIYLNMRAKEFSPSVFDVKVLDLVQISAEDFEYYTNNPLMPEESYDTYHKWVIQPNDLAKNSILGNDVMRISDLIGWNYITSAERGGASFSHMDPYDKQELFQMFSRDESLEKVFFNGFTGNSYEEKTSEYYLAFGLPIAKQSGRSEKASAYQQGKFFIVKDTNNLLSGLAPIFPGKSVDQEENLQRLFSMVHRVADPKGKYVVFLLAIWPLSENDAKILMEKGAISQGALSIILDFSFVTIDKLKDVYPKLKVEYLSIS